MCGALYVRTKSKSTFHEKIKKLCNVIKVECGVNNWNNATEEQLKHRDMLHNNIYLLCEVINNPREAIRLAIQNTKE